MSYVVVIAILSVTHVKDGGTGWVGIKQGAGVMCAVLQNLPQCAAKRGDKGRATQWLAMGLPWKGSELLTVALWDRSPPLPFEVILLARRSLRGVSGVH